MKAFFSVALFMAVVFSGQAQGVVDFRNGGVTFQTTADRLVRDRCGLLVGTNFLAQLYWTPGAVTDESLLQTGPRSLNPSATFRPPTTTAPGTWIGGYRTIGGSPGWLMTLQVRAWDITYGDTWEQARGQGYFASSALFSYTVPQPLDPPSAYYMENFRGWAALGYPPECVPEPSVISLGVLSAALGLVFWFLRVLNSRKERL